MTSSVSAILQAVAVDLRQHSLHLTQGQGHNNSSWCLDNVYNSGILLTSFALEASTCPKVSCRKNNCNLNTNNNIKQQKLETVIISFNLLLNIFNLSASKGTTPSSNGNHLLMIHKFKIFNSWGEGGFASQFKPDRKWNQNIISYIGVHYVHEIC